MTYMWAEPFAGAAACALRIVGGAHLTPPVAWMGGKRRYARGILDAMGVPDGPPTRVLLADAGPWGWVWPLLLKGGDASKVAGVLRSWAAEHPRDLWTRLAAQPPAEEVHERAAQWLWLQARSASGVPIWWDGWRTGQAGRWEAPNGRGSSSAPGYNTGQAARDARAATDRGEDLRWPGHQAQRDSWRMGEERKKSKRGDRTISQKGELWDGTEPGPRYKGDDQETGESGAWIDGRWEAADHDTGRTMAAPQSGRGWRFDARPGDAAPDRPAGQAGQWKMGNKPHDQPLNQRGRPQRPEEWTGRTGGMVNPSTIADRIEALARAFARVDWLVRHGDARALRATRRDRRGGVFVYLDPPYVGATGYGWDIARALVLKLARRWADAGAVVAVSEAEPLHIDGWHHVELTRRGGKPEWLTLSRPPARLPVRQASLFAEAP